MNSMKQNQAIRFPYFAWTFAVVWILELISFCAYIINLITVIITDPINTSDLFIPLITVAQKIIVCIFYGVFVVFLYEKKQTTAYTLPFVMFACGEALDFVSTLHFNLLLVSKYSIVYNNFHYFAEYSSFVIKIFCWIVIILFIKSALGTKSMAFSKKPMLIYSVPFLYALAVLFSLLTDFSITKVWSIGHILIAPGLFFMIGWIIHPEITTKYKDAAEKNLENDISAKDSIELSHSRSSIIMNVLLLLVTCGLWQYIWVWKITAFTNHAGDERYRNPLSKLLLYMLVPFYNVYWIYKSANRLDKMGKEREITSEISVACLVLAFFIPLISFILMQDKLNRIAVTPVSVSIPAPADTPETTKAKANPSLDELIQLKQLLDMGAINQDEYNIKKKQILGLDDPKS